MLKAEHNNYKTGCGTASVTLAVCTNICARIGNENLFVH